MKIETTICTILLFFISEISLAKIEINSGFKDYKLTLLVQNRSGSMYNIVHAEHGPTFLGHKHESTYLLVKHVEKDKYEEIGRLSFDKETHVYYNYKMYRSLSGTTRVLPPKDKHVITFDLNGENDFEKITDWLRENKKSIESAFFNLFALKEGSLFKGVVNFSIKSNDNVRKQHPPLVA
jgi:hypothetical protein